MAGGQHADCPGPDWHILGWLTDGERERKREGLGSRGKLGPSGCSVPLPAPEVWLGDSRPTCSGAPYTQTYTHMH